MSGSDWQNASIETAYWLGRVQEVAGPIQHSFDDEADGIYTAEYVALNLKFIHGLVQREGWHRVASLMQEALKIIERSQSTEALQADAGDLVAGSKALGTR